MIRSSIKGTQQVLNNLKKADARIGANVERALKIAGLRIQRESQGLVPVDLGNLKNSAFTRATGSGYKTEVQVGYTAFYALFVHEAVGMKLKGVPRASGRGSHWDPQGKAQAKFLEEPIRRMAPQLLREIREMAKL